MMSALATGPLAEEHVFRTRLLIADDQPLILAGIRRTLEHNAGVEIVGEAASESQLLAMVERRRPDLVLLDPKLAGAGGLELVAEIRRRWPQIRTVVLSAGDDRDAALTAGASAYVIKSVSPTDLADVIALVSTGAPIPEPRRTVRPVPSGRASASSRADRRDELTERERTILVAVCAGKTTSAISRELWISEHTIKFHLTNIYRKLGVGNRAGAIRYALEHRLVG